MVKRKGDKFIFCDGEPAVTKVGERAGEGREEAKCMNARPDHGSDYASVLLYLSTIGAPYYRARSSVMSPSLMPSVIAWFTTPTGSN